MSMNSRDPNAHRATPHSKRGATPITLGTTPPDERDTTPPVALGATPPSKRGATPPVEGATSRAARSTPPAGNPRVTPAPPTPTIRDATSPTGRNVTSYHAPLAWIGDAVAEDVLIEVIDGRFASVTPGVARPPANAQRLPGLAMPGLANAHSHAFHRALRGQAEQGHGTFWTWRQQMYEVAAQLNPDSYFALARAVYAEMALAGVTCVGEFHYLHHDADGQRYGEPNAMGLALLAAAQEVGIRITLLDTLYLTSSVEGAPLEGPQRRFGDGDVDGWSARVADLRADVHAKIGAALHSVRAVPAEQIAAFASRVEGTPTHVHLSEQRAENEACRRVHGCSPTALLADRGLLGPWVTAVHATHLDDTDRGELGDSNTAVCFCPTTERDLADGLGPARPLFDAGSPLCLGSDSHAVIDLFEEARTLELHERLRTERRGNFAADELVDAATVRGHAALGWNDAGRIAVGSRADLVCVALDTPRTAGCSPDAIVFAAGAPDIRLVIADGQVIVRDGEHVTIGDVGDALRRAIWPVSTSRAPDAGARATRVIPALDNEVTTEEIEAGSGERRSGERGPRKRRPKSGGSAPGEPTGAVKP
jgi:formiminoglutamate deiminase